MNLFHLDTDCNEILEKVKTKVPGFAIASRSWLSFLLQHGVRTSPAFHLCDILTVAEDNDVCLWVIVSDSGNQVIHTQLHYMLTLRRTIKHQILIRNNTAPNLTVRCKLYTVLWSLQMISSKKIRNM